MITPFSQAILLLGIFPADIPYTNYRTVTAAQPLTVTGLEEPNVHQ